MDWPQWWQNSPSIGVEQFAQCSLPASVSSFIGWPPLGKRAILAQPAAPGSPGGWARMARRPPGCIAMKTIDRARVVHEVGATVRLALPLVLAQLAAVGTNVVDALLSGHFSAHVLGAVAVGTSVWTLAIVSGIGVMMAVPPAVAQLDGADRRHDVGAVFRQALWLAVIQRVMLWFGVRHAEPLVNLIGVTPSLRHDVNEFLHAISWGAPAPARPPTLRGLSEGLS